MHNAKDFFDLVKRHFAFLIEDYCFRITHQIEMGDNASVEYCSDAIYVRVLKAVPDYQPYFVFGRIGIDGSPHADSFDYADIGSLDCCRDWQWQRQNDEPYAGLVSQLARLLRECGQGCLNADPQIYAEMIQRRTEGHERFTREEHARVVRLQAEEAWKTKDFRALVSLYEGMQGDLTKTEKGRLSYATKKMKAGDSAKM